jgi:hypothetical protein
MLNPNCAERVKRMLGEGWEGPMLSAIRDGMVNAMPELLASFRILALKKDALMPQEAERVFKTVYPALHNDPNRETSFALRMLQMQFLAKQVIEDSANQLAYCARQSLQGVRVFLAGMTRTLSTVDKVRFVSEGQSVESVVYYAHPMALADGVIALKLREEIMNELREKIVQLATRNPSMQGKDPADFLPAYVAEAFSAEGNAATRKWLGVSDEQRATEGGWGAHYNSLASLNGAIRLTRFDPFDRLDPFDTPFEWTQALHWGFHPWFLLRPGCASLCQSYLIRVSSFAKPLQEFPAFSEGGQFFALWKALGATLGCPSLDVRHQRHIVQPHLESLFHVARIRVPGHEARVSREGTPIRDACDTGDGTVWGVAVDL